MAGEPTIVAVCKNGDDTLLDVKIVGTGPVSEQIEQLKAKTMEFCNDYLQKNNMPMDEVDLMEEILSGDEGDPPSASDGAAAGRKGRKRKGPSPKKE